MKSAAGCMPIYQLVKDHAIDADDTARLADAYEAALQLLQLKDRTDPVTDILARKIITVYQLGERDPARICARAIKELGIPLPD
jgi:hypothetical protein